MRSVIVLGSMGALMLGWTAVAAFQDSTLPAVPSPDECMAAPRELPVPMATAPAVTETDATPTAISIPDGEPADEATRAAITSVIRESIACANAGDTLRALALFSDNYVAKLFVGPDALKEDDFALFVATPPSAVAEEDQVTLIDVRDVVLLPDGRAAAVVLTANVDEEYEDHLILVKVGDHWLIDETIPLNEIGTTPG